MTKALINIALRTLSCNQKELAAKLNVSPTQITKWKNDEHMSFEMADKLRKITNIGELDPEFVSSAGSLEEALKWKKLICYLAATANDNAETGYETAPLSDELDLLSVNTFSVLKEMGVAIPKKFPHELEIDYDDEEDEQFENIIENPYASIIYNIFLSLNDVYGFYVAYICELMNNDELDLYETTAENIEPCLIELAACKSEVNRELATNFNNFQHKILNNYKGWLNIVKYKAIGARVPLRAELLDMVYKDSDKLGETAEAESFGLNDTRIHPDIYMDELLTGVRLLHQILPYMMKKMEIYEGFQPDESDLSIDGKK
ncbi:hypothetical protein FACS1894186_0700 [Alphaproteobacteria bacterium]|nr:hypothetical protein FACS1894186_0700 [Alphaproteobacteria bacterium]